MITKNNKPEPRVFRLGLGNVAIGIDGASKPNPQISFRNLDMPFEIGEDIPFNDTPLENAEVILEIVGIEGLVTLEEMLKLARKVLDSEEALLNLFTEFDIHTGG